MPELITVPKKRYERLLREVRTLRNTKLYQRLIQFEENIKAGRVFTRKNLGF